MHSVSRAGFLAMSGLLAALGLQAHGEIIAFTGFENETPGNFPSFPETDATNAANGLNLGDVVDLTNHDIDATNVAKVDSTATSATAGDLGFNTTWVNTHNGTGVSTGRAIGVHFAPGGATQIEGSWAGTWAGGSNQGYRMEVPNGKLVVTFDPVDLTNYEDVTVSLEVFFAISNWATTDVFQARVITDENTYMIIDTGVGGVDPDAGLEAMWLLYSVNISNAATTATLEVSYDSPAAGARRANFDNVMFEGTLVPEPASTALLGLGGLGILRRRRRA
jgi:hypothetical protein